VCENTHPHQHQSNHTMNTEVRNEIALWLLDRVAQGEHEEYGSMDWDEFKIDGEDVRVTIMKDQYGFLVWMGETPFADFSLTPHVTEELIQNALDLWYDSMTVEV